MSSNYNSGSGRRAAGSGAFFGEQDIGGKKPYSRLRPFFRERACFSGKRPYGPYGLWGAYETQPVRPQRAGAVFLFIRSSWKAQEEARFGSAGRPSGRSGNYNTDFMHFPCG